MSLPKRPNVLKKCVTNKIVVAEFLTPELFSRFGTVISSRHKVTTVKSNSEHSSTDKLLGNLPIFGNNRVLKCANLIQCSPPTHLIVDHQQEDHGLTFYSKVLERQKQLTHTFIPMGRSADEIAYMFVVAPSDLTDKQQLPLIDNAEAFICYGDQAISYHPGVWHSPMIALGKTTDFTEILGVTDDKISDFNEVVEVDSLNVEFCVTEANVSKRKPQTKEEFEVERAEYKGPIDPAATRLTEGQPHLGDQRYDSKQIKYAVERAYYTRNFDKVVELVNNSKVEGKLGTELQEIKRRAMEKLCSQSHLGSESIRQ